MGKMKKVQYGKAAGIEDEDKGLQKGGFIS